MLPPSPLGGLRVFSSNPSFLRLYIGCRAYPRIPGKREEYVSPFIVAIRIYILLLYPGRIDP